MSAEYSSGEMEMEVERRVREKLDAIEAHIISSSKANHAASFEKTLTGDMRRGQEYYEKHIGFEWLKKHFEREKRMPSIPMIRRFKERRNVAVDKIMALVQPSDRHKVSSVVRIIEDCLSS